MGYLKVAQQAVPQLQRTLQGPECHDMPVTGFSIHGDVFTANSPAIELHTSVQKLGIESLVMDEEFI